MSASTITLIMSAFLLFWVLVGFLWGAIRGAKRSFIRLLVLAGFAVFIILFLGTITEAALKIKIGGETLNAKLDSFFANALGSLGIKENGMESTLSIAKTLSIATASSIVFLALFIVMKIISWPIYAIFASIFARKKPDTKKRALLGGLIGIVQGVLICFLIMVPVAGFSQIAINAIDTGVAEEFLDKDTVSLVDDVANSYKSSVTGKVFGVLNLDQKVFNIISTRKDETTGMKINASDEINSLIGVIKAIEDQNLLNTFKDGIDKIYDSLSEKPDGVVTRAEIFFTDVSSTLFNSKLVKQLCVDIVNKATTDLNAKLEANVAKLKYVSMNEIDWEAEKTTFSSIASDMLLTGYGFFKDIQNLGDKKISSLDFEAVGEIFDNAKLLQLTQNIFSEGLKWAIDKFEVDKTIADALGSYAFSLKSIITDNLNYAETFKTFNRLAETAEKMQDSSDIGLGTINDMLEIIADISDENVKEQINGSITELAKEQLGSELMDKINEALVDEEFYLDVAGNEENAKILGGLLNMSTVLNDTSITGESGTKMTNEEIDNIVKSMNDVGEINDPVLQTVAMVIINENTELNLDNEGVKTVFATEADAIGVVLKLNNAEDETDLPDAEAVAQALAKSNVLVDVLKDNTVQYTVSTEYYNSLAEQLGDDDNNILDLFRVAA